MKVHVSLWELDNRTKSISFPVPPETFPTSVGGKAETVNIVGAGERVIFGGEKLDTFRLESFFPAVPDPSYTVELGDQFIEPDAGLRQLRAWVDTERPLYIYSKEAPINRAVVITKLDYERERAGHVGDIFFTLDFITYKAPSFRSVAIKESNSGNSGNGGTKVPAKKATAPEKDALPTTYMVMEGDTIFSIAQKFYGKADYQPIYNANKGMLMLESKRRFSTNEMAVYPGMLLTIPKKEAGAWPSRVTTQRPVSN